VLKKNPEYYTIWNHRRLILLDHLNSSSSVNEHADGSALPQRKSATQDIIANDLRFIVPLLMQYPKCYWIWNYRQWLLEEAERRLDKQSARKLWEEELGLVGKMLTRDERNFHGWGYRRFVVGKLEALRSPAEDTLVEQEFVYTDKMIKAKLQNFSALHYRSKLLPRLLDQRRADGAARRKMLHQELDNMQDALIDPFNQSAWFYHQFLISSLGDELPVEQRLVHDLSVAEQCKIFQQELDRIEEIGEDFDDCKWVYQALIMYTLAYLKLDGSDASRGEGLDGWNQRLKDLDPMRKGRWSALKSAANEP
jgi:geranylgeranyl transferase type-2 subunit alpha